MSIISSISYLLWNKGIRVDLHKLHFLSSNFSPQSNNRVFHPSIFPSLQPNIYKKKLNIFYHLTFLSSHNFLFFHFAISLTRGGATLPIGGAVAPAKKKKKKKKSPPTYRQILIGPPQWCTSGPSPISVQYFNSFPNSSFKCRLFYPLIKQNIAHSPLIFKYPKHYPTKQHFITHFPTQNQKI